MEQSVAFMAGVGFLILGLSYLFRTNDWIAWLTYVQTQERRASLSLGGLNLLIGTFILGFHWVWAGLPLLLTIIGVMVTLKGIVYLLFPGWLPIKLKWLQPHYKSVLRISSIVVIIISLLILCEWRQQTNIDHFLGYSFGQMEQQ